MRDFASARSERFLRAGARLLTLAPMAVVRALGPFVRRRSRPDPAGNGDSGGSGSGGGGGGGACEVCGGPRADAHRHVLQREPRAILCACAPCALLFAHPGASAARLRTIPDRVLLAPLAGPWPDLGIPVGVAIMKRDSRRVGPVALYPSPVGPVEAELDPSSWAAIVSAFPVAARAEPDVEALAIHRREGATASFLAPIDACYRLMAAVRRAWSGVGGGDGVQRSVRAFFEELAARARPDDAGGVAPSDGEGAAPPAAAQGGHP